MTQEQRYDAETLATLACNIGARPAGAPLFDDLAGAIRAIHREAAVLLVDYEPAAAEQVAALVAAERLCCAGIGWHLEGPVSGDSTAAGASAGSLRLRVEASPAQLDIVQRMFAGADGAAQGP